MSSIFSGDPRTAWAWSQREDQDSHLIISDTTAQILLSSIPVDDHVEVFVDGIFLDSEQSDIHSEFDRSSAGLLARTMRRWIYVESEFSVAKVLDGPAEGFMTQISSEGDYSASWTTFFDDMAIKVFAESSDSPILDMISEGAGHAILCLPKLNIVPDTPIFDEDDPSAGRNIIENDFFIVSDWRVAEHIAMRHMIRLGFVGAELTGGVQDRGIDISHSDGVAQVKMQGVPVGAPVVQQLRGTKPNLENHLFYSTAGFTTAAKIEAASTSVALFTINSSGQVHAANECGRKLESQAEGKRGGPDGDLSRYMSEVRGRVLKAEANYGSGKSFEHLEENEEFEGITNRSIGYLRAARSQLDVAPKLGQMPHQSIINRFRHIDLLAATCCKHLGLEYPGKPLRQPSEKTVDDFY